MASRHWVTRGAIVAAVVFLLSASAGLAQQTQPMRAAEGTVGAGYGDSTVTDYPAIEVRAVPLAMERRAIAKARFSQAYRALNNATTSAVRSLEASSEYRDAVEAERRAYNEYLAVRDRAIAQLEADERYQANAALREKLGSQLRDLHAQKRPPREHILALAGTKLDFAREARARETDALQTSAEVKEARRALVEAAARVSALRATHAENVRNDPNLVEARQSLMEANTERVASSAFLEGAVQARDLALDYVYFLHNRERARVYAFGDYGHGCGYANPVYSSRSIVTGTYGWAR